MKRLSVLLAGGFAACAGLALGQQAPTAGTTQANLPGGTIAGHVVEQGTGRPVKRASVALRRMNTPTAATVTAPQNPTANAGAAGTTAARGGNLGGTVGTAAAGQNRGLGGQNAQDFLQNRGGLGNRAGAGATAQTANDGTYVFTDVVPGEYVVTVTLDQYLTQEYGQRTLSGKGTPLAIQTGERLDSIDFQMIRAGVIIGTVVDEDGVPMPGIQVQALNYDYRDGQRVFRTVGSARTTDDSGGYRLYYLTPGDYYVTAQPNNRNGGNGFTGLGGGGGAGIQGIQELIQGLRGGGGLGEAGGFGGGGAGGAGGAGGGGFGGRGGGGQAAPNTGGGGTRGGGLDFQVGGGGRGQAAQGLQNLIQNGGARGNRAGAVAVAQEPSGPQEGYAPAFYPGTIDPAQAAAIHLGPGAEARGIDFSIRPVPVSTLSGIVLQAVGVAAPPARQTAAPQTAQGRGQAQTQAGRGAQGTTGATRGTGNTAPQTAPNAQSPAAGGNPTQQNGLGNFGNRGGQNIQDLISGLRDAVSNGNFNGDLQSLLSAAGVGGNGRASVQLVPIGAAGRGGWQNSAGRASVGEDGVFQIAGVTPGAYNLVASGRTEAGTVTALQRVDVGFGGNITGLSLQLRSTIVVPGQIFVDGQTPENFRTQSLRVQLQAFDDLPGGRNAQAQVSEDGSFRIENVVPGASYRVTVSNVQGGGYVLAGRYGSVNALNAPFAIADEGTPLQLQIGFAPGRVETVVNDADKPVPGAITVLVPNDRGRVDLYRNGNSDKDGKVVFANVPPGDYKLFAWEEIQQGAWQDPVLMEKFEDKGRPVHIEKAGALTDNVQIVRSETRF